MKLTILLIVLISGSKAHSQFTHCGNYTFLIDLVNKEETIIRFNKSTKDAFAPNEDSQDMQRSGRVNLFSLPADSISVPLVINNLPLPKQNKTIALNVNASTDTVYKISMTEIRAIPKLFDVWLKDNNKGDSLNMRNTPTYSFRIARSDTASYGSNRFRLVIRQNPDFAFQLLSFTGDEEKGGAQLIWKTINEENYTYFTVEKSTDNGENFNVAGSLTSSGIGSYSFFDKNPQNSHNITTQYRVKIEDINGAFGYSNIIILVNSNTQVDDWSNDISVYTNPAMNIINLTILQNTHFQLNNNNKLTYGIKIVNSYGLVVQRASNSRPYWKYDIGYLAAGTYFVQVVNNNDKSIIGNIRFVKL